MMSYVRAKNWEINQFFRIRSTFVCGSCERYCPKETTSPLRTKELGVVVASQCRWCGIFNIFVSGGRAIVYDV